MRSECSLCPEMTEWMVNIKFTATPLCESCCNSIMLQTAHVLVDKFDAETTDSGGKGK